MFDAPPVEIGARFDRRTGMCAASPTPALPIQMCPNGADRHVFIDVAGQLYSLFVCDIHRPIAFAAGRLVATHHVQPWCCEPTGLVVMPNGSSFCTYGGPL